MKVYLDSKLPAPEGWVSCGLLNEGLEHLKTRKVTHLSLDPDMGDDRTGTGYDALLWIESAVVQGNFHPPVITVHAVNPVHVASKMKRMIEIIKIRHDCIHNPQPDKYQKGD